MWGMPVLTAEGGSKNSKFSHMDLEGENVFIYKNDFIWILMHPKLGCRMGWAVWRGMGHGTAS